MALLFYYITMKTTVFLFTMIICSLAVGSDGLSQLAQNREWLNFLHYHSTLTGLESSIDDPHFFISKDGKKNPLHELEATLKGIESDPKMICKFPARSKWLQKKLSLKISFDHCQEYKNFYLEKFPSKVYLVFSSYYLESPASAFGHTFLRFSKKEYVDQNKHGELLDDGINYGAVVTTTNPLLYTFLGIVGGFNGTFAAIPYFYKIREYNDFEARDLWSYELKLSEEEKERLTDHLWEVGHTYFSYFFFTENCSQKMIAVLDAVNPTWKLQEKTPLFVVPADTIKSISKTPGLMGEISFRPSIKKVFETSYNQLTFAEKKSFHHVIKSRDLNSSDIKSTRVLDVTMNYLDYKYSREILNESGPTFEWKKEVLKKRSEREELSLQESIPYPKDGEPHLAHGSRRINLGFEQAKDHDTQIQLGYRFALHDLNDPLIGEPDSAAITFFKTDVAYDTKKKTLQLNSFKPVEVETLNPWTLHHKPLSLKATLELTRSNRSLCDSCLAPQASFAFGPAFNLFQKNYFTVMMKTAISYHNEYQKSAVAPMLGPIAQLNFRFKNKLSLQTQIAYDYFFMQKVDQVFFSQKLNLHLAKDNSIGVDVIKIDHDNKIQGSYYHYY